MNHIGMIREFKRIDFRDQKEREIQHQEQQKLVQQSGPEIINLESRDEIQIDCQPPHQQSNN